MSGKLETSSSTASAPNPYIGSLPSSPGMTSPSGVNQRNEEAGFRVGCQVLRKQVDCLPYWVPRKYKSQSQCACVHAAVAYRVVLDPADLNEVVQVNRLCSMSLARGSLPAQVRSDLMASTRYGIPANDSAYEDFQHISSKTFLSLDHFRSKKPSNSRIA